MKQKQSKPNMKLNLSTIFLASATLFLAGCSSSETNDSQKSENDTEANIMTEEVPEYTELTKLPLPCSKELLYTAWKQIGVVETRRKEALDYKQHTPVLFLSTDLDKDGKPEILLRGEQPYAAIFTFNKDSLQLLTFVDNIKMGLAITQNGIILRNGTGHNGASISEFIKLKDSQVIASGAILETFAIQDNAMVSDGTRYLLQNDSSLVEVSKEEFLKVAPEHDGTFLEDIDGWEDFRKP